MILLYSLLIVAAGLIVWRTGPGTRAGWSGFMAWYVAGALFTFSLLTGLSIGLFLLPLVVLATYVAIRSAPDFRATLGSLAGAAVILLVVASIHTAASGWLISGAALGATALASFVALRLIDRRRTRAAGVRLQ